MSRHISATKKRLESSKGRLAEAQLSLEKLSDESPRMEAKLCAEESAAEELLREEKARAERLERELTTEVEERQ